MLLIVSSKRDIVFLKVEGGVASSQKGGVFHQVAIRLSGCEVNFAVFEK